MTETLIVKGGGNVMNHADLHLSFHLLDALVHGGSIVSDYDPRVRSRTTVRTTLSDYVLGLRYDVP